MLIPPLATDEQLRLLSVSFDLSAPGYLVNVVSIAAKKGKSRLTTTP